MTKSWTPEELARDPWLPYFKAPADEIVREIETLLRRRNRMKLSPDAAFWLGKVGATREDPSGCYLWPRRVNREGYAEGGADVVREHVGRRQDRSIRSYRVAYELQFGPVPPGLEVDHLCSTKRCVNPLHLEAVTHAENMQRAAAKRRVANAPVHNRET